MSQPEAESDSPRATRFTRRRVNALQRGFLPEVQKTAFAPMRGASFRAETAEQATSELDAAAQPTWRSALGTPSPLSPLSPLARAIRPLTRGLLRCKASPQSAPLAGGTSPPASMPHPEGMSSEASLSPLARTIRPSVRRRSQGQGQAATEHAASLQLPQVQQAPQVQQQAQQDQPQQAAVPASVVPAEPAVPAAAAPAGPSRGGQSTFLTDEVETPSNPKPNPSPRPLTPTLTLNLALNPNLNPSPSPCPIPNPNLKSNPYPKPNQVARVGLTSDADFWQVTDPAPGPAPEPAPVPGP